MSLRSEHGSLAHGEADGLTIQPMPPGRQRVIFVGGLHRSGTSLLAALLASHTDASGLSQTGVVEDEGQFLQDAYPRDAEMGGVGQFAFDRHTHPAAPDHPQAASRTRQQLLNGWGRHWDASKSFLVEKTPGNALNARYLQSVFGEDCAFVIITRHPIANAMATRKWNRTSLFALVEHWMEAQSRIRSAVPGLHCAAWISYENLARDPVGTVSRLQSFLGMAAQAVPIARVRDRNGHYFREWSEHFSGRTGAAPVTPLPGPFGKPRIVTRTLWSVGRRLRRTLLQSGVDIVSSGREASAIVARYEEQANSYGYSLVDVGRVPKAERLVRPGLLTSFDALPATSQRRRSTDA